MAGGEAGVIDGLEGSVGGKGDAVFFRDCDSLQSGKRLDGEGKFLGGGAEIAQLALACGGGEKA